MIVLAVLLTLCTVPLCCALSIVLAPYHRNLPPMPRSIPGPF